MLKLDSPTGWSLDEFCALDIGEERFLVSPIIPMGGTVLLHGKRNHGKTPLAFSLMLAVANGAQFLDKYPCAKGRVVFVQADMPIGEQQARLQRVLSLVASPETIRIYQCPKPFDIIEEARVSAPWLAEAASFEPDLVIVDSLRKTHKRDENASEVPPAVYSTWRGIFGSHPTLVFNHHDKKTIPHKKDEEGLDPSESFRGSGAWLDDADTGIKIVKKYREKTRFTLYWSKLRTCEDQPSLHVVIDPKTLLIVPEDPVRMHARELVHEHPALSDSALGEILMADLVGKRDAQGVAISFKDRTARGIIAEIRRELGFTKAGMEALPA